MPVTLLLAVWECGTTVQSHSLDFCLRSCWVVARRSSTTTVMMTSLMMMMMWLVNTSHNALHCALDTPRLTSLVTMVWKSALSFCLKKIFCQHIWHYGVSNKLIWWLAGSWYLIPGPSGVKDTNPPALPVLRCLLYLVPSDSYLLEVLVDDSPPVLTWASRPSPETIRFPMVSLSWDPVAFHPWNMSEPSQSSVSNNVFQFEQCSCLSDFLIFYPVLLGYAQDISLPFMVCCFKFLHFQFDGWLVINNTFFCTQFLLNSKLRV